MISMDAISSYKTWALSSRTALHSHSVLLAGVVQQHQLCLITLVKGRPRCRSLGWERRLPPTPWICAAHHQNSDFPPKQHALSLPSCQALTVLREGFYPSFNPWELRHGVEKGWARAGWYRRE